MDQILRVLLVDDDINFLRPMQNQLTKEGCQVETASSSREAYRKIKACNGEFDVAVIDQLMGPPNGIDIMLKIHRLYPIIVIIILTGLGDITQGQKAIDLGAHSYITKSTNSRDLAFNIRFAAGFGRQVRRNLTLQALVSVAQGVGKAKDEEQLYEYLYKEVGNLLPALDGLLISRINNKSKEVSFPFCYIRGKRLILNSRKDGNSITEYVLRSKKPLLLPTGDLQFRKDQSLDVVNTDLGNCESEIVAPLFLDGEIHGTLSVFTNNNNIHYTNEHLQILQAFANQVVVNIRHFQQLEEAKQLKAATATLAGPRGKAEVLAAIVQAAHEIIDSDFTGIILQQEDGTLKKTRPVLPESAYDHFEEPRQQGGITRSVIEKREPRIVRDTHEESDVKESVRKKGINSMLALPLIHGDRVLGVLYAHTRSFRRFDDHDVDLWTSFTTQAAASLDWAIKQEQQMADYRRLAEELGTLNEKMNLKETMIRVATSAKRAFQSDTCRLAYVDPPTGKIVAWAWAEGDLKKYRYEGAPRRDGLTNYVLRHKKAFFRSPEDKERPRPIPELISRGLKSVASLPLIYNNRLIGILHCNYLIKKNPSNEHFSTLMEAFGANAAMALHRANRDHTSGIWRELDRKTLICNDDHLLYKLFAEHARKALGADFALFYPYSPRVDEPGKPSFLAEESVSVGDMLTKWKTPKGGLGGGVIKALEKSESGVLIVNNLDPNKGTRYYSHVAKRERVKAFIAIRLEVLLPGVTQIRAAGILFLNYRNPTAFEKRDLVGLYYAADLVAAGIMRLKLHNTLEKTFEQRNNQLRAVTEIFRTFENENELVNLDLIAEGAAKSVRASACTFLEYDSKKRRFRVRGTYGLLKPRADVKPRLEFKNKYMDASEPTIIQSVTKDKLMRNSKFVKEERIESVVAYPLRVRREVLGILFVDYRQHTEPSREEMEVIGLFADLAAMALRAENLRVELSETQLKVERRHFLVWVSMIEDSWRHTLVQKASSIRNHSENLRKRLSRVITDKSSHDIHIELVSNIDRLAADIAAAPPRVPHYWEMQREFVPIESLILEVAERESKLTLSSSMLLHPIRLELDAIGGVQIRGFRRWLIYLLETLLQNARNAMPRGGEVNIVGAIDGKWAEIRIQDGGRGVPKKIRDKLFKELIPKKQDRVGLGIGSLLAATIVEEHEGSIELERPGPKNTTVLIRLPIARKTHKS